MYLTSKSPLGNLSETREGDSRRAEDITDAVPSHRRGETPPEQQVKYCGETTRSADAPGGAGLIESAYEAPPGR